MHGLAVYVKERLPFARDLSLENSVDSYLCFRLALVSYFFLLSRSPSSLHTVFDSISSQQMRFSRSTHLLRFLSAETLMLIIRTGLPILVELIDLVNSVIIFLSQMSYSDPRLWFSHSPALLDLFISSDAGICSAMAFSPLGNSDHVFVSVSIDFSSNSQRDAPFHRIAYDYSPADWDDLRDYLRDVPWSIFLNSVFLLLLVNFVIDFRLELMYISLIESIGSSFTHLHGFQLLVLLP